MAEGLLAGVRVLDLGQYLPGPFAALVLADLGADVVKVEAPGGDPMRRLGLLDGDGVSAFYKVVNGGKRVVSLDLKSGEGAAAFAELVAHADALVESFRPGVLDRLGFPRERLNEINPRLIHCALTGYGQTGPYRQRAGHDINYMAMGGGLVGSGIFERPVIAHPPVADHASAVQAALAVIAALFRREREGKGAYLDVALAETVLYWQSAGLTAAARGSPPGREASLVNGGAACYRVYRTGDGRFVTLGALEEKFWANFCRAVGRPEWVARQWEAMPQDALIREVAAEFESRPLAYWVERLRDVDTCFEPVLEYEEIGRHPQVAARRMLARGAGEGVAVETLFPAWIDGKPPLSRAPVRAITVEEAIRSWTA